MDVNNQEFLKAIDKLKELKIIKRDSELASSLGYGRSIVSEYINNKKEVSELFMRKLYEVYPQVKGEQSSQKKKTGTPVYDIHATASQIEYSSQLPEVPSFTVNIPGYEDCNFGLYHYGHSMYPTIETGSLLMCRKVNDKHIIMYGEIYLIRTSDYLMVKRLQKNSTKGNVLCTSDNFEKRSEEFKRFEPFELPIDKIIDLYLVKGIIKKTQS